jgi:flagellar biosynthetic protein FlhB
MEFYFDILHDVTIAPTGYLLDIQVAQGLLAATAIRVATLVGPFLALALVAGIAINIVQVGFLFTTKPLMPELNKINPISGFKRMFSVKSLVELAKSVLKIVILGIIAYMGYMRLIADFPFYVERELGESLLLIFRNALNIGIQMCVAMVFISLADFIFQHFKHEKDLKMTKQEVKDEWKNAEGDPKIKGKIRQKQRQMSAMRMMASVPEADVVITNPTHYAVALKYEEGGKTAPLVVAKGIDHIARKIKEVAMEHDVQIVEDKPLAQSLYNLCEVDDEIPAELYQAVADILVFVYRQKGKIK